MSVDSKLQRSRLHIRLMEAVQQGCEVRVRLHQADFSGVPVYIDSDFVELLDVYVPEDDQAETDCERTIWLIRLADVVAISFGTEYYSKEQLNRLLEHVEGKPKRQD